MKPILMILTLLTLPLMAKEYYAKVEPYEVRTVASNVAGLVVFTDERLEGNVLGKTTYLKIDDELDLVELEKTRSKIDLLRNSIALNDEMLENYTVMVEKKEQNYERVQALTMRSQVEKDRDFYDLIASQNQLISVQKETENMKIQVNDLQLRQKQLERSIADKNLKAPGFVLYELLVKENQVVNPGTPLAKIADVRQAKLTLYLSAEELRAAEKSHIYINGQQSDYTITRTWNIADETHLSSYKTVIVIKAPEAFSKLVKIEFKDE